MTTAAIRVRDRLRRAGPRGARLSDAEAQELACEAEDGSLAAFDRLYEAYMPLVLAYTRSALTSAEEAEDAAADAFVRALERLSSFDAARGSFRVWLLSITRNLVIDRNRARRAEPMEPDELEARLNAQAPMVEDVGGELGPRLAAAVARLSPTQRQVIALRYLIGVSNEECARILDKRVATIHQHHHEALRRLAAMLDAGTGERRAQAMSRPLRPSRRTGQSFSVLPRLRVRPVG